MLPMAVHLGITIKLPTGQVPKRRSAEELNLVAVDKQPAVLPDKHIYVGQGWHKHRLASTKWASPFREGQHGTAEECMVLYARHLRQSGLIDEIAELQGCTLVCDQRPDAASPADVLVAEVAAHLV